MPLKGQEKMITDDFENKKHDYEDEHCSVILSDRPALRPASMIK